MYALFGPDKLGGERLRDWINTNLGRYALPASVVVVILSVSLYVYPTDRQHVMEAAYMYTQCVKHRSPFSTTVSQLIHCTDKQVRYCLGTFLVGGAVISEFGEKGRLHSILTDPSSANQGRPSVRTLCGRNHRGAKKDALKTCNAMIQAK